MQPSSAKNPSYTSYHSAYAGIVTDKNGRFTNFVCRPDESHRHNGYWRFLGPEDEQRAFAIGLHTPEDILVGADSGDGPYDDIQLRWVPGKIDSNMQGGLHGNAMAQLRELYDVRRYLGKALSFRGQVPVYPAHPRLKEYWDRKRGVSSGQEQTSHTTTTGPVLPSSNHTVPLPGLGIHKEVQHAHSNTSLQGGSQLMNERTQGMSSRTTTRDQASSPLMPPPRLHATDAHVATMGYPQNPQVSIQPSPAVMLRSTETGDNRRPRGQISQPGSIPRPPVTPPYVGPGMSNDQRSQSALSRYHNTQESQQRSPMTRASHPHPLAGIPHSQSCVGTPSVPQVRNPDQFRPTVATCAALPCDQRTATQKHAALSKQSSQTLHKLYHGFGSPCEPLTDNTSTSLQLSMHPSRPAKRAEELAKRCTQQLANQFEQAQPLPLNILSPSIISKSFQSPLSSNIPLPTRDVLTYTSLPPSSSPQDLLPRIVHTTDVPLSRTPTSTRSPPTSLGSAKHLPFERQPAVNSTLSHTNDIMDTETLSFDDAIPLTENANLYRNDSPNSTIKQANKKPVRSRKRPLAPSQDAPVQQPKRSNYSAQSGTHTQSSDDIQSPLTNTDLYPGLACMECGQDDEHSWDCHIGNLRPLTNLTMLDYRSLAESVQLFDPGPWTTHEAHPVELAPEDPVLVMEGIAEIIRNEAMYEEDESLQALPDDLMILHWAFKTSPNVEMIEQV